MRDNPRLYLALLAWAILGTSTQVFLPYLIIYVQRYLDMDGYAIVLASVLIGAAVISGIGGRVLDRISHPGESCPSPLAMSSVCS